MNDKKKTIKNILLAVASGMVAGCLLSFNPMIIILILFVLQLVISLW